jgi:hypothetical protein
MSLSDFFIRGRQFFGFLIPGAVWVLSGFLLFRSLFEPLPTSFPENPSWTRVGLFFVVSYLTGVLFQFVSFPFTVWLSSKLKRNTSEPAQLRLSDLKSKIEALLNADYVGFVIPPEEGVRSFCKRFVRETTVVLGNDLDSYEEEINLVAMLPLPSIVLMLISTFAFFSNVVTPQFLSVIITIASAMIVYCVLRFQRLLKEEERETYQCFLIAHLTRHK